jgi:hypothetical protein
MFWNCAGLLRAVCARSTLTVFPAATNPKLGLTDLGDSFGAVHVEGLDAMSKREQYLSLAGEILLG